VESGWGWVGAAESSSGGKPRAAVEGGAEQQWREAQSISGGRGRGIEQQSPEPTGRQW